MKRSGFSKTYEPRARKATVPMPQRNPFASLDPMDTNEAFDPLSSLDSLGELSELGEEDNLTELADIKPRQLMYKIVYKQKAKVATKPAVKPKREYVRSKPLMRAYRRINCQNCGVYDGTVCGAHSNWAVHGKGGHIKADDNRCASLCFKCHSALDQGGGMTREQRQSLWWAAHKKTITILVTKGLWPAGVPIPTTDEYPF